MSLTTIMRTLSVFTFLSGLALLAFSVSAFVVYLVFGFMGHDVLDQVVGCFSVAVIGAMLFCLSYILDPEV